MFKQALFCTTALVVLNVSAHAQQMTPSHFVDTPELNRMIDGPVDPADFGAAKVSSSQPAGLAGFEQGGLGHDLLVSMVTWLSTTFDLPPDYEHPRIASRPIIRLSALDVGDLAEATCAMSVSDLGRYEDSLRTIYVPSGWTGGTREEQSVLVHQMVYHLQNLAGMKYGCPQERAKLAYVAQEKWLGLSGKNLEVSFAVDPATFLYSTECYIP